ncbi:MAG: DNA cytosine methyltransferase, partial [Armatimonadetes bacterium]|nr:DNA cytosine methyltransferase [Armatimonadota bacterium]
MGIRPRDIDGCRPSLSFISLFSGAGGLDYGLEAAGFAPVAALEMDRDCCITLRANRRWPVIEKPVEEVPTSELLTVAGVKRGELDLLAGGPPCQPFSKAGYWARGDARRLDDPRAGTLWEFMRCVKEALPKVAFLENVHGISYSGKEEGFRLLADLVEDINRTEGTAYRISWKVLNAADYGIPQARTRFIMIAHREGGEFSFPPATHRESGTATLGFDCAAAHVTAWDAIGDIAEETDGEDLQVKGSWGDLLPSIPEGFNYLWHTGRGGGLPLFGWRTRYWSFLLKLAKNRPSWTIQAQPGPAIGPFHWSNRRLSIREMARLQTIPDDIEFRGSRVSVQRQIGNAVPSLLSEIIGRALAE